jgi:hypothetical protein
MDADPFCRLEASSLAGTAQYVVGHLKGCEGTSHGLFYTRRRQLNADLTGFAGASSTVSLSRG